MKKYFKKLAFVISGVLIFFYFYRQDIFQQDTQTKSIQKNAHKRRISSINPALLQNSNPNGVDLNLAKNDKNVPKSLHSETSHKDTAINEPTKDRDKNSKFISPIPAQMKNIPDVNYIPIATLKEETVPGHQFKKIYLFQNSIDKSKLRIEMVYEIKNGHTVFIERNMMSGNEVMVRIKDGVSQEILDNWINHSKLKITVNIKGKEYRVAVPEGDPIREFDQIIKNLPNEEIFESVFPNSISLAS